MILSKTGSLYRQPNLFRLFLSTSSVLEHELKTHISDVLKTVYLLVVQIGCFHIYKNFLNYFVFIAIAALAFSAIVFASSPYISRSGYGFPERPNTS